METTIRRTRTHNPTMRQLKTLSILAAAPEMPMSQAMTLAGYKAAYTHNPHEFKQTKSWNQILSEIDDNEVITEVHGVLVSADARAKLQAADMLLKLKDRYPAGKLKIQAYNEEIQRLSDGN